MAQLPGDWRQLDGDRDTWSCETSIGTYLFVYAEPEANMFTAAYMTDEVGRYASLAEAQNAAIKFYLKQ